jgi:hypothetical protein
MGKGGREGDKNRNSRQGGEKRKLRHLEKMPL